MVVYDIKRGHYKKIEGDRLKQLMEQTFGSVIALPDGSLKSHSGALDPIAVKILSKAEVDIAITTKKDVDEPTAAASIKMRNVFFEAATGFSAKQRTKRLQQKAKEGGF